MISVSHPVLFHLYRRVERSRSIRQIEDPGTGLQGHDPSGTPHGSLQTTDRETTDFQTLFLKALERRD